MTGLGNNIDRDSFIPYYIQVKEVILGHVKSGEWTVGEQLPGEPQLCKMFNVSRTVIRQALNELAHEGLIIREKGKGTFVAKPKISERLMQGLTGFHKDMTGQGKNPITRVLKQEKIAASPKIATFLGVGSGIDIIQIERLRFVQDEPIVIVSSYLPYHLCPDLLTADLEGDKSLYAYLEEELGLMIVRGVLTFEAVIANECEASLLNVGRKNPLILLNSISYLEDGTKIEYYHAVHRGDRSKFEVELVRSLE
jgi:GntR family transcriptional regulator